MVAIRVARILKRVMWHVAAIHGPQPIVYLPQSSSPSIRPLCEVLYLSLSPYSRLSPSRLSIGSYPIQLPSAFVSLLLVSLFTLLCTSKHHRISLQSPRGRARSETSSIAIFSPLISTRNSLLSAEEMLRAYILFHISYSLRKGFRSVHLVRGNAQRDLLRPLSRLV